MDKGGMEPVKALDLMAGGQTASSAKSPSYFLTMISGNSISSVLSIEKNTTG